MIWATPLSVRDALYQQTDTLFIQRQMDFAVKLKHKTTALIRDNYKQ